MKTIQLMLVSLLWCVQAIAQNHETVAYTMRPYTAQLAAKSLDTLSNTDTSYLYFSPSSAAYNLHVSATYTRITGTAGGTLLLQGSDDNSSWFALNNVVSGTAASQYADTASFSSLSSGSSTKDWFYNGTTAYKYKYYRVRLITSGTQTGSLSGITYYRKP